MMCGRERYLPCGISKEASQWVLASSCQWNQVTILTVWKQDSRHFKHSSLPLLCNSVSANKKQRVTQNMSCPFKMSGLLEHGTSTWTACSPSSIRVEKQIHTQGHKICTCFSLLICSKNKTCYHQSLRNNFAKKVSVAYSQQTVTIYPVWLANNEGQEPFFSRATLLRSTPFLETFNLKGISDNSTKIVFYPECCFQSAISPGK